VISMNFILSKENLTLMDSKRDLKKALEIIEQGNFLSLPVIEENNFIGVISKEKILQATIDGNDSIKYVYQIARKDIPSLTIEDDMEEAALLLAETNTPFVAVNDIYGSFLGIITHKTIFKHYAHILGINKGHKLVITSYDIKGRLALLTDIIARGGGNILSLVIDNPNVSTNVVKIIVRLECQDIERLKNTIEESGFSIRI